MIYILVWANKDLQVDFEAAQQKILELTAQVEKTFTAEQEQND